MNRAVDDPPVLVIDAGHGGMDGGASAPGGLLESTVNLEIALRMRELARLFGIVPVMTRTTAELDYPDTASTVHAKKLWDQNQRVALINATENAVLISIHQNKFPDARPFGAQVLYGKADGSDTLAEIMQANLVCCLCPENRRVAAPISEKIYLTKNICCTAVLAECGFLSNPAEVEKLSDNSYRTKLAVILTASFLQYTS